MSNKEFLNSQKILRLATIDPSGNPHLVPVWYMYKKNKFYVGTNSKTRKVNNIKKNANVSFCIDVGIKSPDIIGVMGTGKARLILSAKYVQLYAKMILLRYFKDLENKSASKLLEDTDCIIEITPKKITNWKY